MQKVQLLDIDQNRQKLDENERILRSQKLQNESFPNFSNFHPDFCPESCSEFSLKFLEDFSCFISWETETITNSPKIPAIFQCKIPRQTTKNIFTKFFWRAGKETNCERRKGSEKGLCYGIYTVNKDSEKGVVRRGSEKGVNPEGP